MRTARTAAIFLSGATIVVGEARTLSVVDARSGTSEHRWRLIGDAPRVVAVHGRFAVYVSGIALRLIRLDTGRDRAVDLPAVGAPPTAAWTARGLFVGYSAMDSPRPGRLLLLRP